MAVTQLILVRHGESAGNVAADQADAERAETVAIDLRDADVPLTERGQAQARALGAWLAEHRPTATLCSPYVRARQTASIALRTSGVVAPTRLDERLRDRELGILDRLTGRGVRARHPEEAARREHLGKFYYRPPGGESWADLGLRLRPVLGELSGDGSVLVVCHDAVIFLLRYLLEGLSEQQILDVAAGESLGNCAVTTYTRPDAHAPWQLGRFNYQGHLLDVGIEPTTHPGARDDTHPH